MAAPPCSSRHPARARRLFFLGVGLETNHNQEDSDDENERKNRKGKQPATRYRKAKSVYAERGGMNSCGDWLAVALKDAFRNDGGGFDLTAFKACLKDNGLTPPNVDMDRHGAIGRSACAALWSSAAGSATKNEDGRGLIWNCSSTLGTSRRP